MTSQKPYRHALIAALLAAPLLTGCATAAGAAVGTVAKVGSVATGAVAGVAVGGVKLGVRGAGAVLTNDPKISKRTLRRKAADTIGADRRQVRVSQIYEDANRTDFVATVGDGTRFNCALIEVKRKVSDAVCALELQ